MPLTRRSVLGTSIGLGVAVLAGPCVPAGTRSMPVIMPPRQGWTSLDAAAGLARPGTSEGGLRPVVPLFAEDEAAEPLNAHFARACEHHPMRPVAFAALPENDPVEAAHWLTRLASRPEFTGGVLPSAPPAALSPLLRQAETLGQALYIRADRSGRTSLLRLLLDGFLEDRPALALIYGAYDPQLLARVMEFDRLYQHQCHSPTYSGRLGRLHRSPAEIFRNQVWIVADQPAFLRRDRNSALVSPDHWLPAPRTAGSARLMRNAQRFFA